MKFFIVKNSNCDDQQKYSQVCGMDGKTYTSLCHMHKANQQIAYTGYCRPDICKGEVCGADKNIYKSTCHAHAHNIRVDYAGKCSLTE